MPPVRSRITIWRRHRKPAWQIRELGRKCSRVPTDRSAAVRFVAATAVPTGEVINELVGLEIQAAPSCRVT